MVRASSFISIAVPKILEDSLCCWWSTAAWALNILGLVMVGHVVIALLMEHVVGNCTGNHLSPFKGTHAQRAFCICSYVSEDRVLCYICLLLLALSSALSSELLLVDVSLQVRLLNHVCV